MVRNAASFRKIRKIYNILDAHFGELKWWPAKTDFEVIIGAILTQNTAWNNVEKAIKELKTKKLLTIEAIDSIRSDSLSKIIRKTGYHRLKAKRLKNITRFIIDECQGSLSKLKKEDTLLLREKLLKVNGVGPETADAILLYALDKPIFVVDAYTKRIFLRHSVIDKKTDYNGIQELTHRCMPKEVKVFNQFHALIVETAKSYCKKTKPLCQECPLKGLL